LLPSVEEGTLPIRHAKTDELEAEERRLLYVGITRARTHLAISWSRKPSRFIVEIRPRHVIPSATPRAIPSFTDTGLVGALKQWRAMRAIQDAVPAYVVAHDSTLEAIAEDRPSSMSALRRVKGMGPVKIDSYGAEILDIVAHSR
jgi:DNA helicase-2/ATP-dependent DNA helicase PcrA